MLLTMIFALAFPTLASAMTGYTGAVEAYVRDHQNSNYIRFDEFQPVLYIVHDGDRIGQHSDFVVADFGDGMPVLYRNFTGAHYLQAIPY